MTESSSKNEPQTESSASFKDHKIAVIGCGLIGQAWAVVFLRGGYRVDLFEPSTDACERAYRAVLERLQELSRWSLAGSGQLQNAERMLGISGTLAEALDGALYIQESGPEDLEIKSTLTAQMDDLAGVHVPIGSSTSGITASRYAAKVKGRGRCLVVHPINPPHLVPAVEIVPSKWTDPEITRQTLDLMNALQQAPILLNREIDGFVVNRLQGALLCEAFRLFDAGIASAADIDRAVSDGLGLRWSFMGPFETIHLNAPGGIAQYVDRYEAMYREMLPQTKDSADWQNIVSNGLEQELTRMHPIQDIPRSQSNRDSVLMALLRHRMSSNEG